MGQPDDRIADLPAIGGLGAFHFIDERENSWAWRCVLSRQGHHVREIHRRGIIGALKPFLPGNDIAAAGARLLGGGPRGTVKVADCLVERRVLPGGMIGRPQEAEKRGIHDGYRHENASKANGKLAADTNI